MGLGPNHGNEHSLLCSDLLFTTDGHFSLLLLFCNKNTKFGLWIVKVAVRQPAPPSFERGNTKLLSEISLSPYVESTSSRIPW